MEKTIATLLDEADKALADSRKTLLEAEQALSDGVVEFSDMEALNVFFGYYEKQDRAEEGLHIIADAAQNSLHDPGQILKAAFFLQEHGDNKTVGQLITKLDQAELDDEQKQILSRVRVRHHLAYAREINSSLDLN